jgi:hypothetical protein
MSKVQQVARNFDQGFVVRHRADIGKHLGIGHLPPLSDVRHAVRSVSGEQGGRIVYLGIRVFAKGPRVHGAASSVREDVLKFYGRRYQEEAGN